jgi:hypothetical protein
MGESVTPGRIEATIDLGLSGETVFMTEDHNTGSIDFTKLLGTKLQVYVQELREGRDLSSLPKLRDREGEYEKTIEAIRAVLARPRVIVSRISPDQHIYRSVEFRTPSMEDLLRIPLWPRVAFAGRCAQRVLPLALLPPNEKHQEIHFSAIEQAIAFAYECAERGELVSRPPLHDIQLQANDDPVVTACVCAALVPFGATADDSAAMAAISADYANWAGWWYNGATSDVEAYEFAAKINTGIWSDFGRLNEAHQMHGWSNHTQMPADFFEVHAESRRPSVFLCHSKEDSEKAKVLFRRLKAVGMNPWLDKFNLVLGDEWESEIKKAVHQADAFVVCLRPGFDEIGFRQKEVRWAREALQLRPPGRGFIIPFVLEPCSMPDWLKPFHAGSDSSKPTSYRELVQALRKHCQMKDEG